MKPPGRHLHSGRGLLLIARTATVAQELFRAAVPGLAAMLVAALGFEVLRSRLKAQFARIQIWATEVLTRSSIEHERSREEKPPSGLDDWEIHNGLAAYQDAVVRGIIDDYLVAGVVRLKSKHLRAGSSRLHMNGSVTCCGYGQPVSFTESISGLLGGFPVGACLCGLKLEGGFSFASQDGTDVLYIWISSTTRISQPVRPMTVYVTQVGYS